MLHKIILGEISFPRVYTVGGTSNQQKKPVPYNYRVHSIHQHQEVVNRTQGLLTSVRVRSIRQTDVLSLPFARTATFDNLFIVTAVRVWNQLPEEIVTITDYNEFRSKCYKFYVDKDDK
ncbi:Protein of unknown function [Cotesia congregata]|uniref:Uncharacterized protein n=1 Tax=Cotesia congregata TaxID=51543 RepID=A0A8J2HN84_COTCN|nr:Protein of unknown function [Cotesia congregata]